MLRRSRRIWDFGFMLVAGVNGEGARARILFSEHSARAAAVGAEAQPRPSHVARGQEISRN
jgi:hypothetical protein